MKSLLSLGYVTFLAAVSIYPTFLYAYYLGHKDGYQDVCKSCTTISGDTRKGVSYENGFCNSDRLGHP